MATHPQGTNKLISLGMFRVSKCSLWNFLSGFGWINIFNCANFSCFVKTLDSEMKRLRSIGVGVTREQAEPLTVAEENSLWEQGLLGDATPQTLIDALLFCFEKWSGTPQPSSNSNWTSWGSQCCTIFENYSKNNAGGLSHRKVQPKHVVHHANKFGSWFSSTRSTWNIGQKLQILHFISKHWKSQRTVFGLPECLLAITHYPTLYNVYAKLVVLMATKQIIHCV